MDRSHTLPKLTLLLFAVLTLASACVRTVALFTHFDADVGYFDATALPIISRILYAAAVILPLVACLLIPKDALPSRLGGQRDVAPLIPLIGSLFFGVSMLIGGRFVAGRLLLALCIGAFLCALFFLLWLLDMKNRQLLALIGFIPVLWSMVGVAQTYGDPYTAMNSPIKLSIQFGLIGFMLAMTAELRYLLDHPQPRMYLYLHGASFFLCITGSVPYLAALSGGIVSDTMHPLYAVFLLGAGLFSLIRMCRLLMTPTAVETEVSEIAAEAADAEIAATTPEAPEASGEEASVDAEGGEPAIIDRTPDSGSDPI